MAEAPEIPIDPDWVEGLIMEMAGFGACEGTGVWRTVYSPEWVQATDCLARWCEGSGMQVRRDAVGNVWGRVEGTEGGKAVVSGSHIDSQRPGGRYDGALGVIAGYVAIAALTRRFGSPKRPLEVLALCEEEGSRFPGASFWASRAITGNIRPGEAEAMQGYDDETMADAMRGVGLDPARIPEARRDDIDAFVELHIEQGPILEHMGLPVAVVTAITGIRHTEVTLTGEQNHAGAFPMDLRRDPNAGLGEMMTGLVDTAHRMGRPAVTTVGRIMPWPNRPAVIPRDVTFVIDSRHPDPEARRHLYAMQEGLMHEVAARRGLEILWRHLTDHPPRVSDPGLMDTFLRAAAGQGVPVTTMPSGAAHDSQQMAEIARICMIFVRSKDGRSHTPEEFSSIPDIVAGIRVLAAGLYELAY